MRHCWVTEGVGGCVREARVREAWVGLWGLGCEARVREAWVGLWGLGCEARVCEARMGEARGGQGCGLRG